MVGQFSDGQFKDIGIRDSGEVNFDLKKKKMKHRLESDSCEAKHRLKTSL